MNVVLAGALGGLGDHMVRQAQQRREEALAQLRRQWQKEDASLAHERQMAMADQRNQYQVDADNRRNQFSIDAEGRASGRAADARTRAGEAFSIGEYYDNVVMAESGGNANARNPRSTATGPAQFTKGTWSGLMERYPDLGLTPEGRTDRAQSRRALEAFTMENMDTLSRAGLPITGGTLYAAHFLGAGGATSVLRADGSAPMTSLVPDEVVEANPFLRNMTADQFRAFADRKGGPGAIMSPRARPIYEVMADPEQTPQARQYAADELARINAKPKPVEYGNERWVENGDGTRTLHVQQGNSRNWVPADRGDGRPVVDRPSAGEEYGNEQWVREEDGSETLYLQRGESPEFVPAQGPNGTVTRIPEVDDEWRSVPGQDVTDIQQRMNEEFRGRPNVADENASTFRVFAEDLLNNYRKDDGSRLSVGEALEITKKAAKRRTETQPGGLLRRDREIPTTEYTFEGFNAAEYGIKRKDRGMGGVPAPAPAARENLGGLAPAPAAAPAAQRAPSNAPPQARTTAPAPPGLPSFPSMEALAQAVKAGEIKPGEFFMTPQGKPGKLTMEAYNKMMRP